MSDAGTDATQKDPDDAGAPSGKTPRRRLRLLALVGLAALVAGGAWFAWWYFEGRYHVSTEDAFIDARIVLIAPQAAGRIVALPVESNVHVSKGDLLVSLDPAEAEAGVRQAEAARDKARTGVTVAEADLDKAKAAVDRQSSAAKAADVSAANARRIADRYRAIVGDSNNMAVSQQQLDTAESDARAAEAQAAEATTAIAEAQAGVRSAEAALAAAKAALSVAEADLDAANVRLTYMTIVAPQDGTIVQRDVGVGAYVSPGSQMMALVPDEIYVTANFKETQLPGLRPGLHAGISVDAYPDAKFSGEVVSIQKGAGQAFQLLPPQNATGNFVKVVQRVPVRISIKPESEGDYVLGPGMSVVPDVHLERP